MIIILFAIVQDRAKVCMFNIIISATNWVLTALTCVSRNLAKAARSEGLETAAEFSNDSDSENDFLTLLVVREN